MHKFIDAINKKGAQDFNLHSVDAGWLLMRVQKREHICDVKAQIPDCRSTNHPIQLPPVYETPSNSRTEAD